MKRALSVFTVLFCIFQISFTEAHELKNMIPNSWHKLTRLSSTEEKYARRQSYKPWHNWMVIKEQVRNVILKYVDYYNTQLQYGYNLRFALFQNEYPLYFLFDSSFLKIYLKDKSTILATFIAFNDEQYNNLANSIKTNNFTNISCSSMGGYLE